MRSPVLWACYVLAGCLASSAPVGEGVLSSWAGQQPPDRASPDVLCGNYSRASWSVSEVAGKLAVSHVDARERRRSAAEALRRASSIQGLTVKPGAWIASIPYGQGWLVGLDHGEFGGGLWWMPAQGRPRQLSTESVRNFVTVGDQLLVLTGIAHLNRSKGGVFEVTADTAGRIGLRALADLGACPYAAHAGVNSLLVVTSHGVARVSLGGTVDWLSRTDYEPLRPRSIVALPSGSVYVGMNRFVAELVPRGGAYAETWYVPGDCEHFTIDEARTECVCTSHESGPR